MFASLTQPALRLGWATHAAVGRFSILYIIASCPLAVAGETNLSRPWPRHVIEDGLLGADGARLKDADGDGLPDIVTGWEQSGAVGIYFNPGPKAARSPWPCVHFKNTPDVEDAVLADLDGDGALDVVSCCEGKTKSVFVHWAPREKAVYRNESKWAREAIPACKGGEQWMFCLPLQVDGQHGVDLVLGSKGEGAGVSWLQAPAEPRKLEDWKLRRISAAGWIMSLLARDMDHDGDADILISDRKGAQRAVRWLKNPGPGADQSREWKSHTIGGAGLEVMFLDAGDVDGDGLEDIAAMTKGECLLLKRRDRGGLNWESITLPLGAGTGTGKAVTIADMNGDGKNDLIMTFEGAGAGAGGKSGVIWRAGNGAFDGPWPRGEISGPEGRKFDLAPVLDVDADGDLDVICTEENDNAKGGKAGLGLVWYENPAK